MSCPSSKASGQLAAGTTAVKASKTRLCTVTVVGDGTNAATVTVYDNASAASGTILAQAVVAATTTNRTEHLVFFNPIQAFNGLTVVVSGTGALGYLTYDA